MLLSKGYFQARTGVCIKHLIIKLNAIRNAHNQKKSYCASVHYNMSSYCLIDFVHMDGVSHV